MARDWGVAAVATAAACVALIVPGAAPAATFGVDPGAPDAVDANPGDGVCDDGGGSCPLRAAVIEANALAGPDVITIPAGTVELATAVTADDETDGDLDVTDPVEIRGAGREETIVEQTISPPAASDRVLEIAVPNFSGPVAISDLTVSGGFVDAAPSDGGGGIRIIGSGMVEITLERVRVSGNVVEGPASPIGGGIYMSAISNPQLSVTRSVIEGNRVTNTDPLAPSTESATGGGIAASGGVLSELVVTSTQVTDNEVTVLSPMIASHAGGGVRVNVATFSLAESSVEGNSAGRAGAVFLNVPASGAEIAATTLAGNEATAGGGGAIVAFGSGTLSVEDSTLAGNTSAQSGRVALMNTGSTLALDGVTISSDGLDGASALSGIGATLSYRRTILDHLGASICSGGTTFTSLGDNLFRASDPACNANVGIGDQVLNPQLEPLANNGGPTRTMALDPLSPAIDAIGNEACPPPGADQRGVPRPGRGGGAQCDIGAFEAAALELRVQARPRLKPGRKLAGRARCLGTPCRVALGARVRLRGGGKPRVFDARPKRRREDLDAGEATKLTFLLKKAHARQLRRRLASSAQARKRTRVVFAGKGTFGSQSPQSTAKRRFKRP